jgi:hypothetical protein
MILTSCFAAALGECIQCSLLTLTATGTNSELHLQRVKARTTLRDSAADGGFIDVVAYTNNHATDVIANANDLQLQVT